MSQSKQEIPNSLIYHSEWMKHLPEGVKQSSILDLCLPGTHGSHAYTHDTKHSTQKIIEKLQELPIIQSIPDLIKNMIGNFAANKIINLLSRWGITQYLDIESQLKSGVRYLDLRAAYSPEDNKFYGAHGPLLVTDDFDNMFKNITSFMNKHKEEVLVISIRPEHDMQDTFSKNQNSLGTLITKIESYLSHWIYRPNKKFDLKSTTLKEMVESDKRIIMIAGDEHENQVLYQQGKHILWPDIKVYDKHWDNTVDTQVKEYQFAERLRSLTNGNHTKLNELSPNLTPNGKSIIISEIQRFIALVSEKVSLQGPLDEKMFSLKTMEEDWYPTYLT